MIIDECLEIADALALDTGGTGRALVGDVIDQWGSGMPDGFSGTPHPQSIHLVLSVDSQVASAGGTATVAFEIAAHTSADIPVDGSAQVIFRTSAFPVAEMTPGRTLAVIELPATARRYLGLIQNVANEALTLGKVNAFLTLDASRWSAYAQADIP